MEYEKFSKRGIESLLRSVRAFAAFKGITSDRIEGNKAHEPL